MREESHIEEMRQAIRADRERAAARRSEEISVPAPAAGAAERESLLRRLFRRRRPSP